VAYRIDREHDPAENLTIAHDDPDLAIPWPLAATILSEADRAAPPMAALGDQLRRIAARTH
jgi:dTDP-4-dehydrorhamnose 3,5-epimerase